AAARRNHVGLAGQLGAEGGQLARGGGVGTTDAAQVQRVHERSDLGGGHSYSLPGKGWAAAAARTIRRRWGVLRERAPRPREPGGDVRCTIRAPPRDCKEVARALPGLSTVSGGPLLAGEDTALI